MNGEKKFVRLKSLTLWFYSNDRILNWINLADFSRTRSGYTFEIGEGKVGDEVPIELKYDWSMDQQARGSHQRVLSFDEVIEIMRHGDSLRLSGINKDDYNIHLSFNCKEVGDAGISGTGKITNITDVASRQVGKRVVGDEYVLTVTRKGVEMPEEKE